MKLLTATSRTQGQKDNDFNWCVEGELVIAGPFVCDRDAQDPDGGCGCGRAFAGLGSGKSTTTAVVADLDFTREDAEEAIRAAIEQPGLAIFYGGDVEAAIKAVLAAADRLDVGDVVERRLDDIQARR